MIYLNKKPQNRYVDYRIDEEQPGVLYKITVTYFIDKGNIISDADIKYTKTILCTKVKLEEKIKSLEKNIDITSVRLSQALFRIGASEANIIYLVKQKMKTN